MNMQIDTSTDYAPIRKRRMRPLKALRHFRNLIANKEDTEQVFHILEALAGDSFNQDFQRFVKSGKGCARLSERRHLPPLLDDHKRLLAMPEGSLGRTYVEFMQREGLSAQGLVDEYDTFDKGSTAMDGLSPEALWYSDRRRDTHDMLHILTGYGRDAMGEACVLAFTHSQHKGFGLLFIAYLAAREVKKYAPKGAPIYKAVNEARDIGRAASNVAAEDILALLPLPIAEVRRRLNIKAADEYHKIHALFRAGGLDPYQALEPQTA